MAQVIAQIPNAVQREVFLLEAARRLQVSRVALDEEVRKAEAQMRRTESMQNRGQAQQEPPTETVPAELMEPLQPDKLIEGMLSLLLAHPELVAQVSRVLNPLWVEGLDGADMLLQLLDAHAHDAWHDARQFLEECDDRTRNYLAGLLLTPTPDPGEATLEAYADKLVQNIDKRWKRQRVQFLNLAVKSSELSVEERLQYLMEIQAIRRQFPDLEP
jgi:DNA primase DnaG DnaB-binding